MRRSSSRVMAAMLVANTLNIPSPALAWGDEGHMVIALIADHYLAPDVKAKVDDLLSGPALPGHPDDKADVPGTIAARATWADKYRDSDRRPDDPDSRYVRTREWHFVDMELDGPDLDAACFGHPVPDRPFPGIPNNCVVDKIRQFAAVLRDPAASRDDKVVALQFLLHFVGDVHQPLHSADNHDQGGNAVKVRYGITLDGLTQVKTVKLHAYWDTVTVERLGSSPELIATALIAAMPQTFAGKWRQDDPGAWAHEAFGVAKAKAYKLRKPGSDGVVVLSASFATAAARAARKQLQLAGYRLAALLNVALAGS